jgi:hypothetical protein
LCIFCTFLSGKCGISAAETGKFPAEKLLTGSGNRQIAQETENFRGNRAVAFCAIAISCEIG